MDESTAKILVLITLVIQNAGQSVIITQSRIPDMKGQTYDASVAVFLQEVVKSLISIIVLLCILSRRQRVQRGGEGYNSLSQDSEVAVGSWGSDREKREMTSSPSIGNLLVELKNQVWTKEMIMMMLPAALYVAQNHLQLIAASNVDATSFAIFSQMKIITTAIFTVTLLGRVLNRKQWLSVFGVFCGVVMVQVAPQVTLKTTVSVGKVLSNVATTRDSLRGLLCLLGSCVLSGFAGVYTEKVLSKSSSSIFASCLQMSLCSVVPAAVPVIVALGRSIALLGGSETATDGLFVAFGVWAWIAVLYNVWGGFTVAITMKIASSLAKSLATSVAVVLTFLISIFWLHETMAFLRIMGAFVVVSSVYVYSNAATPPSISIIEGIASTELECEMSQLDISIGSSIDSSRGGNGHPSP